MMPSDLSAYLTAASRSPVDTPSVPARAIRATSHPGHDPPTRRTLSRKTRFERFRVTAPPNRVPAMKSTRPPGSRASGVGSAKTRSAGCDTRRPPANSRSISFGAVIVRMSALGRHCTYAALGHRILRPLRRRAARMARPAFVDIRLRNPWVLARLRLFGWYVRFTSQSSVSRRRRKAGHKLGDYSGALPDMSKPSCLTRNAPNCQS